MEVAAYAVTGQPIPLRVPFVTKLSRCPECTGRYQRAQLLVLEHPEIGRVLGSVAEWRVELALVGLAAIDCATPALMASLDDVGVHRALIRHLSTPAGSVTWASGCAPVLTSGAGPGRCSPTPWATAPRGALAAVRAAYGQLLADKVAAHAPPTSQPPPRVSPSRRAQTVPVENACLLCGVQCADPRTPVRPTRVLPPSHARLPPRAHLR